MAQALPSEQRPRLVGNGPAECSSCTDLSVVPAIVFDVNGYYRELGVMYWATRTELREAYQRKDGQSSARLTYIIKQLLDPEIRRAYDMTPLGEVFIDRYVADEMKRLMLDRKTQRISVLRDLGVDVDGLDHASIERDIYSEMGLDVEGDTPSEVVDVEPFKAQDGPRPADPFLYSYYLFKVLFPGREVVERLKDWQRFLVTALTRQGVRTNFSVGLHGEPHRWLYAEVGYRKVFFLGADHVPTEELAAQAVAQYRLDLGLADPSHTLAHTGS